jgi:hypothetical protein
LALALAAATLALAVWGLPNRSRAGDRLLTVSELVGSSSAAVSARIEGVSSEWLATPLGRLPFILYQARSQQIFDGSCPEVFTLVVPGLISGDRVVTAVDEPSFVAGQEVVVFIQPSTASAAGRSFFRLTGGPAGVLPIIRPSPDAPGLVAVPVSSPNSPSEKPWALCRLPDLAAQIRAIRENLDRAESSP